MSDKTPILLNDNEWAIARQAAKLEFQTEVLGSRPTRKTISEKRHDKPRINFVQWWAIITLVALTIVTSFKASFVGVPFAHSFATHILGTVSIPNEVMWLFQGFLIVLNILMATPALIYFKLLSEDASITKKLRETQREGWFVKWFDLNYLTPRLPSVMVYVTIAWLLWTAADGLTGVADFFLRFIPVVMELALARLVGDLLQAELRFYDVVTDVLKAETERWDKELAAYETDKRYLDILYRHLRTGIINLVREDERRRKVKPNAWMSETRGEALTNWVVAEYERLTGNVSFVAAAEKVNRNRVAGQPSIVEAPVAAQGKRVPPHGDKLWTVDTLIRDFEIQGLGKDSNYDRGALDRDYASGYGARNAWTAGAMAYFAEKAA